MIYRPILGFLLNASLLDQMDLKCTPQSGTAEIPALVARRSAVRGTPDNFKGKLAETSCAGAAVMLL